MEAMITTQTKTTADDYKKFVFFSLYMKNRIIPYVTISVGALALAAIMGRLAGFIFMPDWYFIVCIGFWGLIALNYIVYRSTVKRFLASDKLVIDRECTLTIDDTAITSKDEKAEYFGSYSWDKLYQAYETKKFFYLYINTAMALVLPKRDFGADQIGLLEELIRDNMGTKFRKR